jgi:hypothetical protein
MYCEFEGTRKKAAATASFKILSHQFQTSADNQKMVTNPSAKVFCLHISDFSDDDSGGIFTILNI